MILPNSTQMAEYAHLIARTKHECFRGSVAQKEFTDIKPPVARPDTTLAELKGVEWLYQRFDVANTEHKLPGRIRHCYQYADRASHNPGMVYCEGYATCNNVAGIPLSHAWCVDEKTAEVFDPVWKGRNPGTGYCGLPMAKAFVRKCQVVMSHYGIIENLWQYKELWDIPLKDIVHPSYHTVIFQSSV